MSATEDPPRLLDDAATSGALANALRDLHAEAGRPSRAQVERLSLALGIAVPGAATAAAAGAAAKASAAGVSTATGLKVVALAVAATVAAGTGVYVVKRRPAVTSAVHSPAPAPTVEVPAIGGVPEPEAAPVPSPADAHPVAPPSRRVKHVAHRAAPAPEPAAPSPAAAPAPTAQTAASKLELEAALVQRAEAVLATHPAEALALAAEHRQRFPDGALAQERDVVTIDALLRLGRRSEAEQQARAFLAAHPASVHAMRVERLMQ